MFIMLLLLLHHMLICIRIVKLHSVKYLFSVFLKHLYCIRINLCQLLLNNNAAFINSFLNIINIKIRIFLIIKQMHLKSLKQFILIKESYSSPCSMLFSINNNILLIFLDTANLISHLSCHLLKPFVCICTKSPLNFCKSFVVLMYLARNNLLFFLLLDRIRSVKTCIS